ncbi:MAG: type II toxin-antitoxin system death-on-curing family toxin [Thermincolia bacterium]
MKYLSNEEILYLHHRLIKRTGGTDGVRDLGLLQSAVARPFTAFSGIEAYQTIFDKAAVVTHSIIMNHPFIDGNKRTGIVAAGIFLRKNNYFLRTTQEEMVGFTFAIARGEIDWPVILKWLKKHSEMST